GKSTRNAAALETRRPRHRVSRSRPAVPHGPFHSTRTQFEKTGPRRWDQLRRVTQWFFDMNGNFQWDGYGIDRDTWFGLPGDIPVVGDWDGTGRLRIGVYRNGQWFFDMNGNLAWDGYGVDRDTWFGLPGDIPVVGDWDGTGRVRIGVYRNGQWFLDMNGNLQWDGDGIDRIYSFGSPTDIPIGAKW